MFKQVVKYGGFLLASTVVVPYAMAFIANMLHGWPTGNNKLRRAFNPYKVYSLNIAILNQISHLRFAKLFFNWKKFYATASKQRIVKNIVYGGSNQQCLDIYLPHNAQGKPLIDSTLQPVVVFVYGGTWSSGDKTMYTLLCAQLADKLKAVVCCPNYSIFPTGYVDDMVQDIVDCLKWIKLNIHDYNGDQDKLMLVGHSSGAHLISLATLELVMKQLLENPHTIIDPAADTSTEDEGEEDDGVTPAMSVSRQQSVIHFADGHFNGGGSTGSKEGTGGADQLAVSLGASSGDGVLVDPLQQSGMSTGSSFLVLSAGSDDMDKGKCAGILEQGSGDNLPESDSKVLMESSFDSASPTVLKDEEASEEDYDANCSASDIETIEEGKEMDEDELNELMRWATSDPRMQDDEASLAASKMDTKSLLHSIKLIVGMAGVYDIRDHYKFEYWRGVEDVSAMARVMYGDERFERFSPTILLHSLPRNTRLPAFHLIHGGNDKTVPVSSSNHFCKALSDMGARNLYMTEIPDCGHIDVCFDLMDPSRTYYSTVMTEIIKSFDKFLR